MSDNLERIRRNLNTIVDGNEITCDKFGDVRLKLGSEDGRVRKIGKVYEDGESVVYHRYAYDRHGFRAIKGWGINYTVLMALADVNGRIILSTPESDFHISAWGAKKVGQTMDFKKSGRAERQQFVRRQDFIKVDRNWGAR